MTHKKRVAPTLTTTIRVALKGIPIGLKRLRKGSTRANHPFATQRSCTLPAIFLPKQAGERRLSAKKREGVPEERYLARTGPCISPSIHPVEHKTRSVFADLFAAPAPCRSVPFSQARVRRSRTECRRVALGPQRGSNAPKGPRKVPEAFGRNGQKTRGPWPKGGNFLGMEAP